MPAFLLQGNGQIMRDWIKNLVGDEKGNPSECIILMLGADFAVCVLALVLIWLNHPPTIPEFAGGISAIHAIGHAGQWANNG